MNDGHVKNSNESFDQIKLERADDSDIDVYLQMSKALISRTYAGYENIDEVARLIHDELVYKIIFRNKVIGYISVILENDDHLELDNLMVEADYQGRGFGRQALEMVLNEIGDSKTITLVTHPDNTNALKLYKSVGFAESERKENYFGDGEPRLIMIRRGMIK